MRNMSFMCNVRWTMGACVLVLALSIQASEVVDDSFKSAALGREYNRIMIISDH